MVDWMRFLAWSVVVLNGLGGFYILNIYGANGFLVFGATMVSGIVLSTILFGLAKALDILSDTVSYGLANNPAKIEKTAAELLEESKRNVSSLWTK